MSDPYRLLDQWLAEARRSEPDAFDAAALAVSDSRLSPRLRMVVLGGWGEEGLSLLPHPDFPEGWDAMFAPGRDAALCLHWKTLRRQVRAEGRLDAPSGGRAALRLAPGLIEFWQDRPFRLHDRFVCRAERGWEREDLYP
jgi:pyridoxamine 5'-phosphate oxidase